MLNEAMYVKPNGPDGLRTDALEYDGTPMQPAATTFLEDGHERRCEAADAMREGKDYVCGEKLSVTSQDGKNHAVTLAKRAARKAAKAVAAAVAAAAPQAEELAPTPEAQEQAEAEAERLTELEDEELEDLGEDDQEEVELEAALAGMAAVLADANP